MLQRMVSHDEMQGCHIESVVVAVEVHDSIHPVGDDQVEARETDTSQNVVVVAADPSVMLRHCYLARSARGSRPGSIRRRSVLLVTYRQRSASIRRKNCWWWRILWVWSRWKAP